MRTIGCIGPSVLALWALGCSPRQLGLPPVALSVAAPDGAAVAEVRNHPEIDPPSQSLWLRERSGRAILVRRLAPDQDWCDRAVWSADSSRVAFLVHGAEAVIHDRASGDVYVIPLVAEGRASLPEMTVRELTFSPDAQRLLVRACPESAGDCGGGLSIPIPSR